MTWHGQAAISILLTTSLWAQQETMGKPLPSGESTGPAHAAVKDAQHRPITAGGFVDSAPVVFQDITKQAGLAAFHHVSGASEKKTIIDSPGSGVALLDYDNDGWLDIYLLNGSTVGALKGRAPLRARCSCTTIKTAPSRMSPIKQA